MRGDLLASVLGSADSSKKEVRKALAKSGLDYRSVFALIETNTFPSGDLLEAILEFTECNLTALKLKCGFIDADIINMISSNADHIQSQYFEG